MTDHGREDLTREILDHHDSHGLTESLRICSDGTGPRGASHYYLVTAPLPPAVPGSSASAQQAGRIVVASVQFQKGPRNEPGSTPGVVEAVLLAILIDRMRGFNAGEYRCRENALVQTKCEEALHWLRHRTDDRARRKVLGTYSK